MITKQHFNKYWLGYFGLLIILVLAAIWFGLHLNPDAMAKLKSGY